jgi:hypothetical protein
MDSRRAQNRESHYIHTPEVIAMEGLPLPGYRLTWVRRSVSGRLWTLDHNGKRVASVSSGVFGRNAHGTYDGRSFSVQKNGHKAVFLDRNGLPLLQTSGLRLPVRIKRGGEDIYGIWKSGFDYYLSDTRGRNLLNIHIDKNAILTYDFAGMTILVPPEDIPDFWLTASAFMYVVKHNLPVDPDSFGLLVGT